MKDEALSLYLPEDLEAALKLAGASHYSLGTALSAAVLWVADNCEDVEAVLVSYAAHTKAGRAITPCRRTTCNLTPAAYMALKDIAYGDAKLSTVVKAFAKYFVENCSDIPTALTNSSVVRESRPKSIAPLLVAFDYATMQGIRSAAVAANMSFSAVVVALVKGGLAQIPLGE
jgi:hypothetical protein